VVRGFCCCCGAEHICHQLVHYPPQRHSISAIEVHRTVIVVRLLAGKILFTLIKSINENICVITNHNLNW
jgi:hypothetical protein